MKKSIILLAACLIFMLSACTAENKAEISSDTSNITSVNTSEPVSKPTESAETEKDEESQDGIQTEESSSRPDADPSRQSTAGAAPQAVAVSKISLNSTAVVLEIGGTVTLVANVSPDNAANKSVTWSTDRPDIAAVNGGTVTAKAAGTAVITASSNNGKTASCTVTVSAPAARSIYDRPYDIAAIEKDMEAYIIGKGGNYNWNMNLDNFGWWVDPLPTSVKWYGDQLKNSLKGDVDARMLHKEYKYFRVYFHPLGNGEYEVYVLCG